MAQRPPTGIDQEELHAGVAAYEEDYNHHRPHQGLGGLDGLITPEEAYRSRPKATAADHPLPAKPRSREVTVTKTGEVSCDRATIHIGRHWAGTTLCVIRSGNHVAIFHRSGRDHRDPPPRAALPQHRSETRPAQGRSPPTPHHPIAFTMIRHIVSTM